MVKAEKYNLSAFKFVSKEQLMRFIFFNVSQFYNSSIRKMFCNSNILLPSLTLNNIHNNVYLTTKIVNNFNPKLSFTMNLRKT